MVDDELQPAETGSVRDNRRVRDNALINQFVNDIERHGEVHATFEHVDGEVECRLGTTEVNQRSIRVFDGDQWQTFNINRLVTWEVPMDLYH